MDILQELSTGFPAFAIHMVAALVVLGLFIFVYVAITPYKEIQLIRDGNIAAAISLSGAIMGFTIPLAKATAQSVNLLDMLIWAGIALVVQLLVYLIVRMLIPEISRNIPEGKIAQGTFLGILSLASGVLNSACMTI